MKFRRKVRYRVEFVTEVEVEINPKDVEASDLSFEEFVDDSLEDYFDAALCDLDIPDRDGHVYCDYSFEVVTHEDLAPPSPLEQLAEQSE
jgi:hypothetical protein